MGRLILVIALAALVSACNGKKEAAEPAGTNADSSLQGMPMGRNQSQMMGNPAESMQLMNEMMLGIVRDGGAEYDMRFIDMMIPHHEGAILMAADAEKKAVHPELRDLARKMIAAQRSEIQQMISWRKAWYGDTTNQTMHGHQDMMQQNGEMSQFSMTHLGPADSTYDARFIEMMIPHHDGAIRVSEDALGRAEHPELKKFAQKIIDDQRREIGEMERWRGEWYSR